MGIFNKKTWKNRLSEYPNRRRLTKENGTSELVTVSREEGSISQEGDAFSEDNMNDLEERVEAGFDNLTSRYNAETDYIECLVNGEWVQYERAYLNANFDPATWDGLQNIVSAGLGSEMLAVGDSITETINGEEVVFDIVQIDYREGVYGKNIILGARNCLKTSRAINAANTTSGGYNAMDIAKYLDGEFYNGLPEEMKAVISDYTFQGVVSGGSSSLQNENHKVWLPLEYNVFGNNRNGNSSEKTVGGAEQFSYYLTDANKVKKLGEDGANTSWWTATPGKNGSYTQWCAVLSYENGTGYGMIYWNSEAHGICPHFMIKAV